MTEKPIIIFDGICNLCNSSVDFIIKRDHRKLFLFTPYQSDTAKEILKRFGIEQENISSICLVEEGKISVKSDAILSIVKRLSFPFSLGYLFIIVPRAVRDFLYHIVVKNRYLWFGRKETCRVSGKNDKDRFLG